MTRADIFQQFPQATEDQVAAILALHHKDVDEEKKKRAGMKDNEAKIAELQAQIDAMNTKDLTEMEKMQKSLEDIQSKYEASQKTIKEMELKNSLLAQGISEEDAGKFIETMNADKFDASVIGTMIANAISAHDKDKMQNTPDPSGAQGQPDTKSDAEKIAETMFGGSSTQKQSVISNYL